MKSSTIDELLTARKAAFGCKGQSWRRDSRQPMTEEQTLYLTAVENYRKKSKVKFVSTSEHLAIAKALGYRKVAEAEDINNVVLDG